MNTKKSINWLPAACVAAAFALLLATNSANNAEPLFGFAATALAGVVSLDQAQQLVEKGVSVIPLKPRGKAPAIRWREFSERFATDAELRQWWGPEAPQPFNIGLVCGAISRLVGIDADSRDAAVALFRRLPQTPLMVKTARGVHFLYRLASDQIVMPRVRARVKGIRADLRGERSLLVGPTSVHPTGSVYAWVNDLAGVDWDSVPQFDESWIDAPDHGAGPRVHSPLNYIQALVARSGAGGHATTFRCACVLRDAGLSEAEALAALVDWNRTNAVDADGHPYPWTTADLLHKVRDAYRKGGAAPART